MSLQQDALESLRIERSPTPPRSRRRLLPWSLAVIVPLWLMGGLMGWHVATRDATLDVRTVAPTTSGSGVRGGTVLSASGYVVARRQATVSAKTTGKLAEVLVEEGISVTEGRLLARLDATTLRPAYALAERQLVASRVRLQENRVRLAEAERSMQRMERLRADKLVSEAQLDAAASEVAAMSARMAALQSEVEVAAGTLAVRKQELADLLVYAPFSGIVISKDAQPGEIVSPVSAGGGFTRTGIVTIVDMDSREIELDVNEAFINRVAPKQRTQAVLDAYPDWEIPSHVIGIVPAADRQKATVRVRVAFDELDPRVLPDMGVKVSFLEDVPATVERPTLRVPSSAIVGDGEARHVWRVVDGRAERIAVRTGAQSNGQTEVLAGIDSSDRLIADPAAMPLQERRSVRIKP